MVTLPTQTPDTDGVYIPHETFHFTEQHLYPVSNGVQRCRVAAHISPVTGVLVYTCVAPHDDHFDLPESWRWASVAEYFLAPV